MKRFRARDDDAKGEFAVESMRVVDATTRGFIAKTVVASGMFALTLTVVVSAWRGDSALLTATIGVMSNLLSFVLGRYFDKGKNG